MAVEKSLWRKIVSNYSFETWIVSMIKLIGTKSKFCVSELEHVHDLYHDGPLLSEFTLPKSGNSYLHLWCDRDKDKNRWMIVRVSDGDILRMKYRITTLYDTIFKSCQDESVCFVDQDSKGNFDQGIIVLLKDVPEEYRPTVGIYLDK